MSISSIFNRNLIGLHHLRSAKVFLYPSAGMDFRPLVYFNTLSDSWRKTNLNREITSPDVFVFSSIGSELKEFGRNLKQGLYRNSPLYEDATTLLEVTRPHRYVSFSDDINLEVNTDYIDDRYGQYQNAFGENNGVYLTVKYTHKRTGKSCAMKLIMLEIENMNFMDEIVSKKKLDIEILCTTREGLGFGFCLHSVLEYWTTNRSRFPDFKPKYLVDWRRRLEDFSEKFPEYHYYQNYILETLDRGNGVERLYSLGDCVFVGK